MLTRLNVRDRETPEAARRRFDGQLSVRGWGAPGRPMVEVERTGSNAPWWWQGDEEASQSFLTAMGVKLE